MVTFSGSKIFNFGESVNALFPYATDLRISKILVATVKAFFT